MKKNRTNIILLLIFLIGLSVMLYPSFSNYWNDRHQSKAVASYNSQVQKMNKTDYKKMFAEAEAYNKELSNISHPFENYGEVPGYDNILDVTDTGIMGYVTIDKIKVELPIYHGTSEGVLQIAVGHLAGSSLPVGGKGTHTVLSAHRGLPSAKLFSNLDKLEEGDTFEITVLNKKMTYQVDQIHIVNPDNLKDLQVDPDKDYCTLMTCTPYGINTHRLLVRGVRVDGTADAYVPADAYQIEPKVVAVATTIALVTLAMVYVVISWIVKCRKRTAVKEKDEEI